MKFNKIWVLPLIILLITYLLAYKIDVQREVIINVTQPIKNDIKVEDITIKFIIDEQYNISKYTLGELIPLSGKWNVESGELSVEDSGSTWDFFLINQKFSNFIFETKVNIIKPEPSNKIGQAGLIFRENNNKDDETAQVILRQDSQDIYMSSGNSIKIAPFKSKLGEWHSLKVVVQNYTSDIYIDNILVGTFDDLKYPSGYIGFRNVLSHTHFSDASIKKYTNYKAKLTLNYSLYFTGIYNLSLTHYLTEKSNNPSNTHSYYTIYTFSSINYTVNGNTISGSDHLSFPIDLIRPPDLIYFPTEPYNRTFAIRLIARGWDEQRQEWVFKEFMSPEFTWEDVVEGRTIAADGSRQ